MLKEKAIRIADYDYPLPEDRIAFYPKEPRDTSRLLVYCHGEITDSHFFQLAEHLEPGTMLIFNNSKVIHARLRVHNATGAAIEIFCLEPLLPTTELASAFTQTGRVTWKCFVGNAKRWKHPLTIIAEVRGRQVHITAEKGENSEGAFPVTFTWPDEDVTFAEWIEAYGKMPLPAYIKREASAEDESRYQTIYARHDGSVAAPTAGLHFSDNVLTQLRNKNIDLQYLTLHVGAGTFKPVTTECIGDHYMHQEQIVVTRDLIKQLARPVTGRRIAVGTTVVRTLESLFLMGAKLTLSLPSPFLIEQWEAYENPHFADVTVEQSLNALQEFMNQQHTDHIAGATRLMIVPTYKHHITQGIITNFHQPKSTLLLLIASYIGDDWHKVYDHALNHDYRFLSYGDSNLYIPD